jgi:hypothetical protein
VKIAICHLTLKEICRQLPFAETQSEVVKVNNRKMLELLPTFAYNREQA